MISFFRQLMHLPSRIPGQVYLWLAVPIFGSASAITRKITEIGAENFIGGQNPISLCNVLFVGNLCALLVFGLLYRQLWQLRTWQQLSGQEWLRLGIVALLAGALAPGLIFQALTLTPVTTVVVLGRLELPVTLGLSMWLLGERANRWELLGAVVAFIGVVLTIVLQPNGLVGGMNRYQGELLTVLGAIALAVSTIVSKKGLGKVPLGVYSTVRTGLGTIIFFCIALNLFGPHHFMGVLSPFLWQWMLLYGAIIVVLGQSFWTTGLRASSVVTASLAGSLTPVMGVVAAYWILGEVPTFAQYIGGSVILLGLIFSQVGLLDRRNSSHSGNGAEGQQPMTGSTSKIASTMGFKGL